VAGADITMGLPRMEELYEARQPKRKALIADVAGKVSIVNGERRVIELANGERVLDTNSGGKMLKIQHIAVQEDGYALEKGDEVKVKDGAKVKEGGLLLTRAGGSELIAEHGGVVAMGKTTIKVVWEGPAFAEHPVPVGYQLLVKDGDEVQPGDAMTEGHLDLAQLFKLKGRDAVMRYMLKETLYIYASQGIKLNSKHVETIIRQMFSRIYIREAGDTDLLPGEVVEKSRFNEENERVENAKGEVATGDELFMGITKVSLSTESFLSAASFQETAKVLINAAITGKLDKLEGLKENVIIGRLIPTGEVYRNRFNLDGSEKPNHKDA
jgi:DNA-directed RNA polymerase subunit beta'